jgi:hypothetical protein
MNALKAVAAAAVRALVLGAVATASAHPINGLDALVGRDLLAHGDAGKKLAALRMVVDVDLRGPSL